MMKKNFFLLLLTAVVSIPVFGTEHEIQLRKKGTHTGSRSTECTVNASIDELVLTVSYNDVTASSVTVYEVTDPDTVLFSQSYLPALSTQAYLPSLPAGTYVVELYAFDDWWIGIFEIN